MQMKTKTINTNTPSWRTLQSKMKLTQELLSLDEIAHNLWWTWNKEPLELFPELDQELWMESGHNPVILLQRISIQRIKEIQHNPSLMDKLNRVIRKYEMYMERKFDTSKPTVSYFSMEYGFSHILRLYSGGLGILAGDYLKEASDSSIKMTGIGLLYRYGYFTQTISPDGHKVAEYEAQNFSELPMKQVLNDDGEPLVLPIPYPGRNVYAHIAEVNIGKTKLYLLNTDIDLNSEFDRRITHQLYGGDWENRIKQEYLLGIGGILLLRKLGIDSDVYHCNEGHAAFLNIQRLVDLIEGKGLNFDQALEVVRASCLYTVHTPVPSGHDYFEESLLGKYMNEFPARLGISWQEFVDMGREHPGSHERFSMSVFALNTCLQANGVSLLHGQVSRKMFQPVWPGYFPEELHVGHVTNGVHMPTWTAKEMKILYENTFGPEIYQDLANPDAWQNIRNVPDEILWEMRLQLKKRFLMYIGEQLKNGCMKDQVSPSKLFSLIEKFNPNALLVGFARRFATYKRAHLLFSDLDRLAKLLNNEKYPVHFIFAGKAHPADVPGQDLIKKIIDISHLPEFAGKIIFLENYDMQLAKRLISGVDIWLNTPTRPLEASGTSGQKALMNGVLNFSVLDGWWYEGYREDAGFCLPAENTYTNVDFQNELDAVFMYYIFEHRILPLYYAHNSKGYSPEWIRYIKNSISNVAPLYTTRRMINDYTEKYYKPLSQRTHLVSSSNYKKARELAQWKADTTANWDKVEVEKVTLSGEKGELYTDSNLNLNDETVCIEIELNKKGMAGDLGIDFVMTKYDIKKNSYDFVLSEEIPCVKKDGDFLIFRLEYEMKKSGMFRYAFRMYPKHPEMSHRMDFAYVRWI